MVVTQFEASVFWRVGHKLGRTVYAITDKQGSGVDADTFIGIMETPQLAAIVCDEHNAHIMALKKLKGAQ